MSSDEEYAATLEQAVSFLRRELGRVDTVYGQELIRQRLDAAERELAECRARLARRNRGSEAANHLPSVGRPVWVADRIYQLVSGMSRQEQLETLALVGERLEEAIRRRGQETAGEEVTD